MSFNVKVEPSGRTFAASGDETLLAAAIRQGIGLPYGCKDGACGSCKCKKLEGTVMHGTHQSKALSAAEEEAGYVLTCCAVPHSDVVLESRQVTDESAFPIRKMPARVSSLARASHDVMLMTLQLPANEVFKYHAGQYVEFILRDGSRRSYSMANAPHTQADKPGLELHIRHMPGGKFTDQVFSTLKEKDILRIEGPFGSFFLREESTKPLVLLASGTGFAPIKAIIEHMQVKNIRRPAVLYWGGRRPADVSTLGVRLGVAGDRPLGGHVAVKDVVDDVRRAELAACDGRRVVRSPGEETGVCRSCDGRDCDGRGRGAILCETISAHVSGCPERVRGT